MLKGRNSRFEAYADKFIHLTQDQMRCIRGTSRSGGAITICDAIGSDISGTHSYRGKRKEFISLFPHYVAIGPRHIETHKAVIAEVMFTLSGATALFYDLGAFSTANIKNIRRLMPAWAKKDRRKITFSEVFYCVDRGPMVSLQLADRKIEVFNAVSWRFPSPRGINMTNEVRIHFKFKKPNTLKDAV